MTVVGSRAAVHSRQANVVGSASESFASRNEASPVPTRHREAEVRGERIGRPLRMVTGLRQHADEALLDRLGVGLMQRDELAADLVSAMRRRMGDEGRVSRSQFATALAGGPDATLDKMPGALTRFMTTVRSTPPGSTGSSSTAAPRSSIAWGAMLVMSCSCCRSPAAIASVGRRTFSSRPVR